MFYLQHGNKIITYISVYNYNINKKKEKFATVILGHLDLFVSVPTQTSSIREMRFCTALAAKAKQPTMSPGQPYCVFYLFNNSTEKSFHFPLMNHVATLKGFFGISVKRLIPINRSHSHEIKITGYPLNL